jgi:hypothetical protein
MKEFLKNIINEKVDVPYHYASKVQLDKEIFSEPNYHLYSNTKEVDEEYQKLQKDKLKLNPPMKITSKSLKLEYNKKLVYLNINLRRVFLLSIILIIDSLINLKYIGYSELYISIIILSAFSITITLILLFNIQTNVLLDLYGYSSFYLFSLFESSILIIIYILKLVNFLQILFYFFSNKSCRGQNHNICKKNVMSYFIILINIIIFIGVIFQFKYTIKSLIDAFCVLVLKQKTTVQKQHEINEKQSPENKIEFDEDSSNMDNTARNLNLNTSEVKIDTLDNLKTE